MFNLAYLEVSTFVSHFSLHHSPYFHLSAFFPWLVEIILVVNLKSIFFHHILSVLSS